MYPFNIQGVVDSNKNEYGVSRFALNADADESSILMLVRNIPPKTRVMFYDRGYPSPSDPGAYVSFMRLDGRYIMQRANHGWSNRWQVIDQQHLEDYLLRCANIHKVGTKQFEEMSLYTQVDPPPLKQIKLDPQSETVAMRGFDRDGKVSLGVRIGKIFLTLLFIVFFLAILYSFFVR